MAGEREETSSKEGGGQWPSRDWLGFVMASNNIGPPVELEAKMEGVGITWVRCFDEGIVQTMVDKTEQGIEVISGPRCGKWKRAAQQGPVEEPNLNKIAGCGKNYLPVFTDGFSEGSKKSKHDSSETISEKIISARQTSPACQSQ
ncbi:hypothetical protein QYF36_020158 [Acer negundo]|nr:hypothetical protein QYF36_020158 [Acer negundo]